MSRLTRKGTTKIHLEDYLVNGRCIDIQDCLNKLGKLEDLEEQLGCTLEVVFKAVNYGIYNKRGFRYKVILNEDVLVAYPIDVYDESWELSNYKKTWWLEKDKSE